MKTKPHGIERINDFLRDGFVAIGWPGLGDLTKVTKEEIKERLEQKYGYGGLTLGYNLGVVNSLVNVMSEGDLVLVRDGDYVHIGTLGAYRYVKELDNHTEGICHQRPTEWHVTVNWRHLNDEVQSFVENRNSVSIFPYPTATAELEQYLRDTPADMMAPGSSSQQTEHAFSSDDILTAQRVLRDALNSIDESLRVKAAIAILQYATRG